MLRRPVLVMGILHGNAHLLQREHRIAAQITRVVEAREVEVPASVEHLGAAGVLEVVELQLRPHVEYVAPVPRLVHRTRQHLARVALEGTAVRGANVAEHARNRVGFGTPRQHLERRGIRKSQHIGLLGATEALDAASVEAHAVGERALQFAWNDREGFHEAEHISEPEANEVNIAALDGFEYEILLRA